MQYIRIENDEIIGIPQTLPLSWNNISNFYVLGEDTLRSYGWYPYENENPILSDNQTIVSWSYVIESHKVVRRATIRSLSEEEIQHRDNIIVQKKWEEIRNKRNKLLIESDWTQLSDVSVANKESWKLYRQNLRDITNAPTPDDVVWPIKPSPIEIEPYTPPVDSVVVQDEFSNQDNLSITEETTNEDIESIVEETQDQEIDPNLGG